MTIPPDVLRLLAVPILAWAAIVDYRSRRVPGRLWYPMVGIGVLALVWEASIVPRGTLQWQRFLLSVGLSIGLLVPLGYGFYRLGGFGRADAKAFAAIAIVFPTFPIYRIGELTLPLSVPVIGVFSLTIVSDAVIVGAAYPIVIALWNLSHRRVSPVMCFGYPVPWTRLTTTHGKLLQDRSGLTVSGLDLDALRMYLRWRGLSLPELRERATALRDPTTLPDDPYPPTDGSVDVRTDGGSVQVDRDEDPWGAAVFLAAVGGAYGTTPEQLRAGLDHIVTADTVWISPGIPFLVPLFVGLVVALTYGDVLFTLLGLAGVV